MAEPWKKYQAAQPTGPWSRYQSESEEPAYRGSILPLSRMPDGSVKFDANAGIVGALKRAVTLPGEVMRGDVPVRDEAGNLTDEVIGRATEMGAVVSPANPMVRSGDKVIPGVASALKKPRIKAPSADDLYQAADDAFARMRDSGVDYRPEAVAKLARTLKQQLENDGFAPEVAKSTHKILDKLASPPEGAIADIRGIHAARKAFGQAARNFNNPSDQAAASRVVRGLDEFIGSGDPANTLAGAPAAAAKALQEGNANFAAAKRSDLITGIERAADLRAASTNSGANVGNSARQRIASALLSGKQTAGFSPEEIAALEKIVRGTRTQNVTRSVGNLLGGGGGLGRLATSIGAGGAAGAMAGSPELGVLGGVVVPLVGAGAKQASNAMTQKAIRSADKMIRSRSPLAQAILDKLPAKAPPTGPHSAIIKALLLAEGQGGGGGGF